jgi:Arc/MetJ-type ribon-helix-helix transcriptional regulator
VGEALRVLAECEKDREARLEELRREIQKGSDAAQRGEFVEFSAARLKGEWRRAAGA